MTLTLLKTDQDKRAFQLFSRDYKLNKAQENAFLRYLELLLKASQDFNLTAITKVANIIDFHFRDSLRVTHALNLNDYKGIVDVGTGGGFPGIPIKICYPEIPLMLIEVNNKKIAFLNSLIDELGLYNIDLYRLDWRTFLRKTDYELDLFVARASLAPAELMRMFKPSCPYNKSTLVYWAADTWQPTQKEAPFLQNEIAYPIKNRKRKLVFFSKKD